MPSPASPVLDINSNAFFDKVYGCWMGKSCGGTLGTPLEKAFGEDEPFDVWWYPKLQAGGLPNDDLEMQLVWLKALEDIGPQITATDLAQYWLSYIHYNFDEYGLCRTNLKLGLLPPVAGHFNNWFKDCMGSPIRSEVWACVAPGAPRVACLYAYEDSIVDHAGGEGLYGEFFNTAIQSAAFVETDRDRLLQIGLSYVPEHTRTFVCVRAAIDAHAAGVDWKEARRRVLAADYNPNSQYAPINMGFQTVGWLYGEDFGDSICKAVNCGWDTDCTGATLGSILGILGGYRSLPQKWVEPLGDGIATNEDWGGLQHLSEKPNPTPTDIRELTVRTVAQAHRVLAYHRVSQPGATDALEADADTLALLTRKPTRVSYSLGVVRAEVDYLDHPALAANTDKTVVVALHNSEPIPLAATCELWVPKGWAAVAAQSVEIPARGFVETRWTVAAPGRDTLEMSNQCLLHVKVADRPAPTGAPVVFVGANARRRTGILAAQNGEGARAMFDRVFAPETLAGDALSPDGRPGPWTEFSPAGNSLELQDIFQGPGALYVQTFLWSPEERTIWMGVPSNCPTRAWVNGALQVDVFDPQPFRPNYAGIYEKGEWDKHWCETPFRQGWNELLIKYVRASDAPVFEAHLVFCAVKLRAWLTDLGRTRFPWDAVPPR